MRRNTLLTILLLAIVLLSSIYLRHLARQMEHEESQRVAIWAEATERFILAEEDEDIDFYTSIIEQNTSIPVYMTDTVGNILLSRNVKRQARDVTSLHGPILVNINDQITQYIYYDDSNLLTQLKYFPWVLAALILVFFITIAIVLHTAQQAEKNYLWAGLSKETAHQLGTPISSLNAWSELLSANYPNDEMIPEMKKDIDRLHVIADRFSKIGSMPELKEENLDTVIQNSVSYFRTRLGKRIHIEYNASTSSLVQLSAPLFSWVLENLMKNAVDAGATDINITLTEEGESYQIDIHDNGKGISGTHINRVFEAGYTTKQRGWGLGLSLAKRIVERYHHGKLFILSTTQQDAEHPNSPHGTTFRILIH